MKSHTLKILFFLFLASGSFPVFAQTGTSVVFGYDEDGNRSGRWLTMKKMEQDGKSWENKTEGEWLTEVKETFNGITISIFPNPTQSIVNVNVDDVSVSHSVTLINASGEVLENKTSCYGTSHIDLGKYPNGMYFIRLDFESGNQVWKVIKQ